MSRIYNFNAGPAVLPFEVLEQAAAELVEFKGTGMSIMEHSHRGKDYEAVHVEAIDNIKKLLGLATTTRCCSCRAGPASSLPWFR